MRTVQDKGIGMSAQQPALTDQRSMQDLQRRTFRRPCRQLDPADIGMVPAADVQLEKAQAQLVFQFPVHP